MTTAVPILNPQVFSEARSAMQSMVAEGWSVPVRQEPILLQYGLGGACAGVALIAGWDTMPLPQVTAFMVELAHRMGHPPRVGRLLAQLTHLGQPDGPQPHPAAILADWDGPLQAQHAATLGRLGPPTQDAYDRGLWWRQAADLCARYRFPADGCLAWVAVRAMLVEVVGCHRNPFLTYLGVKS